MRKWEWGSRREVGSVNAECGKGNWEDGIEKKWEVGMRNAELLRSGKSECGMRKRELGSGKRECGSRNEGAESIGQRKWQSYSLLVNGYWL